MHFSRRTLVAAVASALAGTTAGSAPAPTPGPDGLRIVAEEAIASEVAVAGVTWAPDAPTPALLWRTISNGRPTAWLPVHADGAGAADDLDGVPGSAPLVITGADRVQIASRVATVSVTLSVFDAAEEGAEPAASDDENTVWALASTAADRARPTIHSRAEWGAAPSRQPVVYGVVSGVMLHHTDQSNAYTAAQVPGILRAIQRFHQDKRRWSDIAYNVLVDRFGRAWEGRAGGLTRAVVGGHSFGVTNERIFGLAFIGNFQHSPAPAAMLDTAEQVVAWKFLLHGVNPAGIAWATSGPIPAISGHRDDRGTDCPGVFVYRRLGEFRGAVRAKMDAARRVAPGGRLKVTGTLDRPTVQALQRWLGVKADGVLGARTIRALQERVGAPGTGVRDAATTRGVQRLVGVRADGLWGAGTTRALQGFLNAQ